MVSTNKEESEGRPQVVVGCERSTRGRDAAQHVKSPLGMRMPYEHQFQPNSLLMLLGKQWKTGQVLGPPHPCRRSGRKILALDLSLAQFQLLWHLGSKSVGIDVSVSLLL